jgi:hypothetical protein
MTKKIEFVPVSDPQSLKQKLEEMVNNGWEIKGFVCCNSGDPYNERFAVLERSSVNATVKEQDLTASEEKSRDKIIQPVTAKKEISISLGGN